MKRKLILGLDYNNLVFGSWFGDKLVNSNGMNVNAIRNFFFKIKSLKDSLNPDYIVLANDLSRDRTFRRKMYKPYKAHRKPVDPDIIQQLRTASQITALLGWPMLNHELYEADDILGMISKYALDNDMDMVLASSDKDMYQLISTSTCIFSPRNKEVIDIDSLYDKYQLTPTQWIEMKMLMGDRSDNIQGITGIGEVTAVRLLQEYNTIENIYKNINVIHPKLRDALLEGESRLPLIRDLVTIITDYTKIDFDKKMMENRGRYPNELYNLIENLEIHSLHNVMTYCLLLDKEIEYDTV